MFSRRLLLLMLVFLLTGCTKPPTTSGKLSIGVVSFEGGDRSLEKYSDFKDYLGGQLNTIIELEPTYNELKALEQIKRRRWDLVFAPPGLAAIAISEQQYVAIFPLEGVQKTRSVIVVLRDSKIKEISNLARKVMAFGKPGSATGYYLPIYNLYGLTLSSVRFAPTPKTVLEWIAQEEVDAGAMSVAQFNRYRSDFLGTKFRILYTDSHRIPSGVYFSWTNGRAQPT